jgi:hypothetical protein
MLDNVSRAHCSRPIGTIHDEVNLGLLIAVFVDGNGWGLRADPTTIPCASNLITWDDLGKTTSLDVPYFNEAGIEEQNIWCVECNAFSSTFPLNSAHSSAGVSMFVNVQSEFYNTDKNVAFGEQTQSAYHHNKARILPLMNGTYPKGGLIRIVSRVEHALDLHAEES